MSNSILEPTAWSDLPADKTAMTAVRAIVEPNKGRLKGDRYPCAVRRHREPGDRACRGHVRSRNFGGVSGWWCRPETFRAGEIILHLHSGWFNWGSAQAFRNLIGHLAARTGVKAFTPDYRLVLENPFSTALDDAHASYAGLFDRGYQRVAITGDTAGGSSP